MIINWSHIFELNLIDVFSFRVVSANIVWKFLQYIAIFQPHNFITLFISHQSLLTRDPYLSPSLIFHYSLFVYKFDFNFTSLFIFDFINYILFIFRLSFKFGVKSIEGFNIILISIKSKLFIV